MYNDDEDLDRLYDRLVRESELVGCDPVELDIWLADVKARAAAPQPRNVQDIDRADGGS